MDLINGFWNGDTSNNSDRDVTEAQLLIASKMQSTTTDGGWLLNEDGVYASRYNAGTIRIMFEESFGLIDNNDEPVFRQIDWHVNGFKSDGSLLDISGQQFYSQGHKLLQADSNFAGGYNTYFFDIPEEVVQGSYTIVLQFRTAEGAEAQQGRGGAHCR